MGIQANNSFSETELGEEMSNWMHRAQQGREALSPSVHAGLKGHPEPHSTTYRQLQNARPHISSRFCDLKPTHAG